MDEGRPLRWDDKRQYERSKIVTPLAFLGRWKKRQNIVKKRGKIAFGFEDRKDGRTSNPLHGAI
jgi:hypothetical protein